jgi:hypothetical protein
MNHEGPSLELLLRRLTETPSDFLAEPRTTKSGLIHVAAVVSDLFAAHGYEDAPVDEFAPQDSLAYTRQSGLVLILCWLLADPALISRSLRLDDIRTLFTEGVLDLSSQQTAAKYLAEPERREELARFALARLDLRPAGETLAQAQDRLSALSSAERARVIKASRKAEHRARQIREALARKAAEEAADKYTRE